MVSEFLSRFREAVTSGDLETAELLFLEEMEEASDRFEELQSALRLLAEEGEKEKAAQLLPELLDTAREKGKEAHLSVLRQLCLCAPRKLEWRRRFAEVFKEYYSGRPVPLSYLKAVNLTTTANAEEAFERLDRLLCFEAGSYLEHPGGWGVGKVREVLPLREQMVVDLEGKRGHRVAFSAASNIFRPLPGDHFLAWCFDRMEEVKEAAENDPLRIIRSILSSLGNPFPVSSIKEQLCPRVLSKGEWFHWWNRVKNLVRNEPFLRLTSGKNPAVELLSEPVSKLDGLIREFYEGDSRERLAVMKQFQNQDREGKDRIRRAIGSLKGEGAESQLEALLLEHALGDDKAAEINSFLQERFNGPELVRGLQAAPLASLTIRCLAQEGDFETLVPYFLRGGARTVHAAAPALRKKGEERFLALLNEVYNQPRRHVRPFLWLYSVRMEKRWKGFLSSFPARELLSRALSLFDFVSRGVRREEAREELNYARSLFSKAKLNVFQEILFETPKEKLGDLYMQLGAHRGLRDDIRSLMREKIAAIRPDVVKREAREEPGRTAPGGDGEAIYVTESGFRKRQEELRQLLEVQIPATMEEVGRAREFGDLSENAEWSAALEKRENQKARASEIRNELRKARIIGPEMYEEAEVSLGCEVKVKNLSDGGTYTWSVLGPWDGALEDGVLNYLSPVGRSLLGHRAGEVVSVALPNGEGRYEILSVSKAGVK